MLLEELVIEQSTLLLIWLILWLSPSPWEQQPGEFSAAVRFSKVTCKTFKKGSPKFCQNIALLQYKCVFANVHVQEDYEKK